MRLRVLSYNIHKGFSSGNRRFILATIRDAIREVDADLVFLQEVLGEQRDHAAKIKQWPSQSQFEYLADSVWPHYAYGRNSSYDAGHHGNALLSKYPIISSENQKLSTYAIEQRGLLHAHIEIPGQHQGFHCFCVHLGLTRRGRKVQLERICQRAKTKIPASQPLILAGDFNDWSITASKVLNREVELQEAFKRTKGRHAATFPSSFPILALDRIYVRHLHTLNAKVLRGLPWRKLSDHAALLVELEF